MNQYIIYLPILLLMLSGCDMYPQDNYEELYVVESYLVAGDTLPPVRFSTTSPINQKYEFQEVAVEGAEVEVRLLNTDSTVAETYPYQQLSAGIYHPVSIITVQESRLYQLFITAPDGQEVSSITYVPENFETVNELSDSYPYQGEEQIKITTTPSSYLTDRQTYYIFTVNVAEDPNPENLTPFYLDLVQNQDEEIWNFVVNSSGIINEENYDRNENNMITLHVPWLSIAFYGPNNIIANAIDDNMYDFLRTQDVQGGGTSLSPGEIQNIKYNVDGGIGIFGSMASDTNHVFISRP